MPAALVLTDQDFDAVACRVGGGVGAPGETDGGDPLPPARSVWALEDRVLDWAKAVCSRLSAYNLLFRVDDLPPTTEEAQGIHLAFVPAVETSSGTPVPYLAFRMDAQGILVSLELPGESLQDIHGMREVLVEGEPAPLLEAMRSLPNEFVCATGSESPVACRGLTSANLTRQLVSRQHHDTWWAGWQVPRAIAVAHADTLAEQLSDALVALAMVFRVVAGPPRRVELAPAELEKGSRVRVISGVFAGKTGTVAEVLGRGEGVRIQLGLLSATLPLESLALPTDPRDRPPLRSSHRQPLTSAAGAHRTPRRLPR